MTIQPTVRVNNCWDILWQKGVFSVYILLVGNFCLLSNHLFIIDSFHDLLNINICKYSAFSTTSASSSLLGLHIYVQMCVHSGCVQSSAKLDVLTYWSNIQHEYTFTSWRLVLSQLHPTQPHPTFYPKPILTFTKFGWGWVIIPFLSSLSCLLFPSPFANYFFIKF